MILKSPTRCARTVALRDGMIVRGSPAMMLLRLLSWPYLRRHLLRWTLTLAGIVLGVAVFVAMHTANPVHLQRIRQNGRSDRRLNPAAGLRGRIRIR